MRNLIPYESLKWITPAFLPLFSRRSNIKYKARDLTMDAFLNKHEMTRCDVTQGRYIACAISYAGDVTPKECQIAAHDIKEAKDTVHFVSWVPTGFKIGISRRSIKHEPENDFYVQGMSMLKVSNHSSMAMVFDDILEKFKKMHSVGFYTFWYTTEGMEMGEFDTACERVEAIVAKMLELGGGLAME